MSTPIITEQIRWQDLKVRGEVDIVLEIAKKEGWKDCEVFGYGDMITEPQEIIGWKLIPADVYEHSIPPEAVRRLYQVIHAGIRVRGVIIADDQRKEQPAPAAASAKPRISLPSLSPILSWVGNALLGFVRSVGAVLSFSAKALLGLIRVAGVIVLVALAAYLLIQYIWPILLIGAFLAICAGAGTGANVKFDPKLVVLVDDGNGGTTWVSLYTWYD